MGCEQETGGYFLAQNKAPFGLCLVLTLVIPRMKYLVMCEVFTDVGGIK